MLPYSIIDEVTNFLSTSDKDKNFEPRPLVTYDVRLLLESCNAVTVRLLGHRDRRMMAAK
jgi:hypothetical protein